MSFDNSTSQAEDGALPRQYAGGPPEQNHRDQIPYAAHGDNAPLKQASDCLGFGWDRCGSIDEFRATPNPEDKPAAHARKVRSAIDDFEHEWSGKWDGAKAALIAEHKRVEADLEAAAGLKVNPRFEAIVCNRFLAMKSHEHAGAIDALIEAGDMATLATLIEAPTFATGVTPDVRDSIKVQVFSKIAPANLALRDELVRAIGKLEAASYAGLKMRAKLREGTDRYDRKVKAAEAVAAKTKAGFIGV